VAKNLKGRHTRISIISDVNKALIKNEENKEDEVEEDKSNASSPRSDDNLKNDIKLVTESKSLVTRKIDHCKLLVKNWAFNMETFFVSKEIKEFAKVNRHFMLAVLTSKVNFLKKKLEVLNEKIVSQREVKIIIIILKKVPKSSEIPEFKIVAGMKTVNIIDNEDNFKFYQEAKLPTESEIFLAYRTLFQLIRKDDLLKINDDALFWQETCKFLTQAPDKKIGI
jgi:hypothetical protein